VVPEYSLDKERTKHDQIDLFVLPQRKDDRSNAQDEDEQTQHCVAHTENPTPHKSQLDTVAGLADPEHGDEYDEQDNPCGGVHASLLRQPALRFPACLLTFPVALPFFATGRSA
jgi:hypothetical protein